MAEIDPMRTFEEGNDALKALYKARTIMTLSRLIHEVGLKTKIADGILLRNQNVPTRT
jgi:hypothetical protein